MKIENKNISYVTGLYRSNVAKEGNVSKAKEKNGKLKGDALELSTDAKALSIAYKAAKQDDGVRMGKVEHIKRLIESGKYDVKSTDIATKMIKGVFLDKRV
ncbi:MAG: flagellar biosynthesis anti-sigma factor FlgM [Xylanivirga thermophila]|uniref:flagellar biosynthesis anti-sigma factor FlgM n=1 Tax=Xylanivirga thermophila TaxID=2496273 RepID=UPI0013EC47A1|nr:flagellar biosynthesis anti-sigma factor FlgM [Xylanivirga thermophila]